MDIIDRRELPIAVFDSGVGGLTIIKEILNILPQESVLYLGDTARVPYGAKSAGTVKRFTEEAVSFFASKGIKMLLVACNTSSSLVLPDLSGDYGFKILGVVDAGVEEAAKVSRIKRIGVIGTEATISSGVYERKLKELDSDLQVFSKSCPLFVPLVEEGWIDEPESYKIASKYLKSLKDKKIDTLILGCTHYPLMKRVIQYGIGEHVALIDSAKAFVKKVREVLLSDDLLSRRDDKEYSFYVTDEPDKFNELSELFLGAAIGRVKRVDLKECNNVSDFNKV
ncbi:MAG: glutamate racemase [Candidatus Kaelpia imicola]|nr:glutamate racemase [Candidatus Kaelpia imicola]